MHILKGLRLLCRVARDCSTLGSARQVFNWHEFVLDDGVTEAAGRSTAPRLQIPMACRLARLNLTRTGRWLAAGQLAAQ